MRPSVLLGAVGVRRRLVPWGAVTLAYVLASCGQTVPIGVDDPLNSAGVSAGMGAVSGAGGVGVTFGGAGFGSGNGGGGASSAGGEPPCAPTECRGKLYACGDCNDNDDDGLVDALDPACLGPCDDDEVGFSTGLANNGAACRQDCYFDGDAGPGNDKCEWSHQCDPLSVAPSYPPSGEARCGYDPAPSGLDCASASVEQPTACLDSCLPLVPNGCDCFGCCELPARSGQYRYVGAGRGAASCSLNTLTDAEACPPCTPVSGCLNDCELCEACVGSGPDPSCEPTATCDVGQDVCDATTPCAPGFYCVTGCCVQAPVR